MVPLNSFKILLMNIPSFGPVRPEFVIFGLMLAGIALFHRQTFRIAVAGTVLLVIFKLLFDPGFDLLNHISGSAPFIDQLFNKNLRQGEWEILLNLLGLLLGFAILSKIFEESHIPDMLPKYLPDDWKGPFVLLVFVMILSSFLDNIAAAMIGGTIASVVFKGRVHIGYIAAIVAASNAGGSGSVVGDTTTTMMWIDGVSPVNVLHAFIAAGFAFLFFGLFASRQQDRYQKIQKDPEPGTRVDKMRVGIVVFILAGAILGNVLSGMPALGVWIVIVVSSLLRPVPWKEIKGALKGSVFLICLVFSASLMPVEYLPGASWKTVFSLGFVSSVFDNIPLTKLCLAQGAYDWGMLAYCVGFGGSMIWFGSSAGVAITNKFGEGRDIAKWLRYGWHVIVAYIIGFFALLLIMGWEPSDNRQHKVENRVPGEIHKTDFR